MVTDPLIYANYIPSRVPEYEGNPLIEALPEILSEEEAAEKIAHFPNIDDAERSLPRELRLHCINRLKNIVQPLPIHLELESSISTLIRSGYVGRNPMTPSTWAHLHTLSTNRRLTSNFHSSATTFSLIGLSGIGKTTALDSILRLYPQTIFHKKYKNREFIHTQISWLKIECPYDGSLSGLCRAFFKSVDKALGQEKYTRRFKSKGGIPEMIETMEQIASTYFVGAIFIDELQHLNTAKTGGKDNMLNFFVNLINSIGIPVVFIGTNSMAELFSDVLRNARRACGLGIHDFKQPANNDEAWAVLVETIWNYQWLATVTDLTDPIREILYDLTQGVTDFLAKLMILGQRYAISSGEEKLSVEIFKHVAETKMKLLKPALAVLRSGDPRKMRKFEDLIPTDDQLDDMMIDAGVLSAENRLSVIRAATKKAKLLHLDSKEASASAILEPAIAITDQIHPAGKNATISSIIGLETTPREVLRQAGWLQEDPLEFSDFYRKLA